YEKPFAVLYADEASRPNIPINVLVGLETLKAGFGWSDEEMYENFCFNLQVRYTLGYRQLNDGHFEIRTIYNFRRRLSDHMQQRGQALLAEAFVQITDEQLAAFALQTSKLRMDSTQVSSNIRQFSRLQLLVEVLQRVQYSLSDPDQQRYQADFEPYLCGSAGQYVYHLKPGSYDQHLAQIGQFMHSLVTELAADYAEQPDYQLLLRVFHEHFIVETDDDDDPAGGQWRPRQSAELSADSLQSPDDGEATYRVKRGQGYQGYVTNVTESCHPDNPLQLIVDLHTAPNNTDDAAMLADSLPTLKQRTGVEEMHTDGGYNSPDLVDPLLRQHQVELVQSAIRGRQPNPTKLNLDDYTWQLDPNGQPLTVTAPSGQRAEVEPGRVTDRYIGRFTPPPAQTVSATTEAPTEKSAPPPVLYFSRRQLDLALRRQRTAQERASSPNLRAAVEASIGALKRPFPNDKLPVRGLFRVSSMLIGSALMINLRRIHRYQTAKNHQKEDQQGPGISSKPFFSLPSIRLIRLLVSDLSFFLRFRSVYP
ncbi:MAG: transposase, partial [Caldilineaceae bacterium]|nr:transposase [Caldilineaceae bacterium]